MTAKQTSRRKQPAKDTERIDPAIDALLDYLAERAVLRDSYDNSKAKQTDS